MDEIVIDPTSTKRLGRALDRDARRRIDDALASMRNTLSGRRLWHVNSASASGGVAEMLSSLLPYAAGAGIDVHWGVIDSADDAFFEITKRLHNRLHETDGDGGSLGDAERDVYERTINRELESLRELVAADDVVVLHDPQTIGMAPRLAASGARVLWRCHIGVDRPGPLAREAWNFLRAYIKGVRRLIFSRPAYVWDGIRDEDVVIMAPCIDLLSPKNQLLDDSCRAAILQVTGAIAGSDDVRSEPVFHRSDGTTGVVSRSVTKVEDTAVPTDAQIVLQVSRWDGLKDPVGVIEGFVRNHALAHDDRAHLVLAGPATSLDDDDPESVETFEAVRSAWEALPRDPRRRVHIVCLPLDDLEENGAIVNALQGRADVVVQKSLVEGFGLTVAEAMWKRRPVVGSRVGGIQDQIVEGESGILVDPDDLAAYGAAVADLLADSERARRLGDAAHQRVCECFLPVHHFAAEAELFGQVAG